MRICLIASSRYPITEPFAGGLESMTHTMARGLSERGHEVTLFAGPGSTSHPSVRVLPLATVELSAAALADVNAPHPEWIADHHAYLDLMLTLSRTGTDDYDVVHNNSLHHLPVAMASALDVPLLTTLHTPPLPMLESALALSPRPGRFVAVSGWTADAWRHVVDSEVVLNGLDLRDWPPGEGGGPAVWSGRIVPEKAPHLAIEACRAAGVPLVLAGPVQDQEYFRREVAPRLGQRARYAGHLDGQALSALLRRSSVAVVTPVWDEPYGLVAAEAMASGTPVAAFARGGLAQVVAPEAGVLAAPGDVDALTHAVASAVQLDRGAVRAHAEATCSADRMIARYLDLYADLGRQQDAA
ncbi:Glycosyltransferase involved in cell wall bisynthesis [Nocardioides exalbidus]|uniref:Glycosyltransferase involved in cell wall bisynthesis n=1 Tax=Nocardioides exalbidus TaxID=402596 RepID=A0A1H4Y5R9_9ACTN|nr:glycosyltransferase family 4 protein [Nocardioides exalbidus]SED13167.1 Glycosyltransferase involved in cell wall bisynthesis [Nocardioides exalbidus]